MTDSLRALADEWLTLKGEAPNKMPRKQSTTSEGSDRVATTEELSDAAKTALAEAEAENMNGELVAEYQRATGDEDFTVPPELASFSKPANERTEAQLKVDSTVERYHDKWVAAGSIKFDSKENKDAWNQCVAAGVVGGYWLLRTELEQKRKDLKASAQRLGYGVKFGGLAPRPPKLPQDGRLLLSFVIKDVDKRGPRATS
jgi:hypothetical protein